MSCKNFHKDLIFYLGKELSEERMEIAKNHLEECIECQQFLSVLQEEIQIIENEKNPEVSPYFFTRLSARLEEKTEYQPQSLWTRIAQPAFFSVILIAGIYGGLRLGSNASTIPITEQKISSIQLINDFEAEPIESFLLNEL